MHHSMHIPPPTLQGQQQGQLVHNRNPFMSNQPPPPQMSSPGHYQQPARAPAVNMNQIPMEVDCKDPGPKMGCFKMVRKDVTGRPMYIPVFPIGGVWKTGKQFIGGV